MAVFFNISNHPSSGWTPEQINAVRQILCLEDGDPQIVDIPFPQVSPDLGEEGIRTLADTIFSQVAAQIEGERPDDCAAMVMGEQSLSYHITRLLESVGIRVYVATTERVATEKDGVKTSVFKFRRFRRVDSSVPKNRELMDRMEEKARAFRKERAYQEWKSAVLNLFRDGGGTDTQWQCPYCRATITVPAPFSITYHTAPDVWREPVFPHKDSGGTEYNTFWAEKRKKLLMIMAQRHFYNRCGDTLHIRNGMPDMELYSQLGEFDARLLSE